MFRFKTHPLEIGTPLISLTFEGQILINAIYNRMHYFIELVVVICLVFAGGVVGMFRLQRRSNYSLGADAHSNSSIAPSHVPS